MKKLITGAVLVLIWLQYNLWFGQSGHFAQVRLQSQLNISAERVSVLKARNALLTAEVIAMKSDPRNLESRARSELGMIKKGEVFYLIGNDE